MGEKGIPLSRNDQLSNDIMWHPKEHGCPVQTHKCDECGEVYEYYSWFTVIFGKCDDCTRKAWEKVLNS